MNTNTGMGVEQDERADIEERGRDGRDERDAYARKDMEPAADDLDDDAYDEPEEAEEPEQTAASRGTEAGTRTEAETENESAGWREPAAAASSDALAEPYIGPGPVAEPVAEPEPESAYAVTPGFETDPVMPAAASTTAPAVASTPAADSASTVESEYSERMREIQLAFIDDPRQAARDADGLLDDLLHKLTADLDRRRSDLGSGLLRTDAKDAAPPTESLRVTVQQSRELIDLLAQARERVQL